MFSSKTIVIIVAVVLLVLAAMVWGFSDHSTTVPTPPDNATSTSMTLGIGETGTFRSLSITFNQLIQDSRCPIDVKCIEAGAVNTNVTFTSGTSTITQNMPSDEVPLTFAGYAISIQDIHPPRESQKEIPPSAYRITFFVKVQ